MAGPAAAEHKVPAKDENRPDRNTAGRTVLKAKAANAGNHTTTRPALGAVDKSVLNTKKCSANAKASDSSTTEATQKMASAAVRKPRVPLATVSGTLPQVYRDPVSRRPRRAAASAAQSAIQVALKADERTAKPRRILRTSSASNIAPTKAGGAEKKASGPVKPEPVIGRKRRAASVEPAPTRAVRARVSASGASVVPTAVPPPPSATTEPVNGAKSDATAVGSSDEGAWPETQSTCSSHSFAESQATAVDDGSRPELYTRKIAKPSRAFSSMRSMAGPAAFDLPPKARTEEVKDWDDIDAEDADDPLMVSEYICDIIDYMREQEQKTMPDHLYMNKQTELTWDMRRVLVNWMVQAHYQLRMLPETLFLAVNLVDRFLSKRQVSLPKVQLVGLTGLLVACKYEEMATPHVQDFAYLAGNCYSVDEIMNAEVFMLRVLDFDLSFPSPLTFLRRVSKAEAYDVQTRTVAKYLMEICLVDNRLMSFPPSHIAAAGICLARRMLKSGPWNANLRHYSGYTETELQPCMALMLDHMLRPFDEEFVFKKYQHKRYLKASIFCREWVARHRHELQPVTPPIGAFSASVREVSEPL
ncbi:G2/mitotic-specific cyclin [Coemansia sp. RSA 552]|nr:G2/mitotic-specific cyclin [Coemansia sp. RSA 552]